MAESKQYVIVVAVDYSETGNLALERAPAVRQLLAAEPTQLAPRALASGLVDIVPSGSRQRPVVADLGHDERVGLGSHRPEPAQAKHQVDDLLGEHGRRHGQHGAPADE